MKVILFDGVCNLCNGLVNWIIDRDNNNIFKFSALQSTYGLAQAQAIHLKGNYMDTVVLIDEGEVYLRSSAVLRIFKYLGGLYPLLYAFIIVPPFIRNFFYILVARNRYKWFGKQDVCRIPTPELKNKFLE